MGIRDMNKICNSCGKEFVAGAYYAFGNTCPTCMQNSIKNKTNKDNINPLHYKFGGIETFDYLKAKLSPTQLAGFCKGNIIKYVSRADHKNKLEDLKKAKWYLDKLIEELEND